MGRQIVSEDAGGNVGAAGALVGATVCQSGTDLGGDRQHQRKRVAGVGTRCGSTPVARTDRVRQVESLG